MLSPIIIVILFLVILSDGRVLLYDTENITSSSEKFDCIYVPDNGNSQYGGSTAGSMPYCRRPNTTDNFKKADNTCKNGGQQKYFVDLLEENVRPSELLEWCSSIEMVDKYAAFYYNYSAIESNEKQDFLCRCTDPNIFGKYCEYQLTHEANSFEVSQSYQASLRSDYYWDHQQFIDIRDICDGSQQCENGWDEENCEKLEFNECEEDEYRCSNGMCVPEEYWLDGNIDCMDWSDEDIFRLNDLSCFWQTTTIDCDEHICSAKTWSCGDGQCILWRDRLVFQNIAPPLISCSNMRNMNYMCELTSVNTGWTLPNGLCSFDHHYDDTLLSMANVALSEYDKCIYLIRCALSDGLEIDCPCNHLNCSNIMSNECKHDEEYLYPPGPLIRPYVVTLYYMTHDFKNKMPHVFLKDGNVRCRRYHNSWTSQIPFEPRLQWLIKSVWDTAACITTTINMNLSSSMKYDDDCWKNSLTFNGYPYAVHAVCISLRHCISQYRIKDEVETCLDLDHVNTDTCTRVRRHRFQCSSEQPTCFIAARLGDANSQCLNNYDEYFYGHGRPIKGMLCRKTNPSNCQILKEYIKNSSLIFNSSTNSHLHTHQLLDQSASRIRFRSYCDTFWNLEKHVDELPQYCQNWICHRDQYQCHTGQCIPLEWVCDGEWDCADASDEEAMFFVGQWSSDNEELQGLNERCKKCNQLYSNMSFSELCIKETEFPCLRSNVSNPLDVNQNHPCISYSKIGDGIEDCYNAYDEKNTFADSDGKMWGFTLKCGNKSLPYPLACQLATEDCAQILCSYLHHKVLNCSKPNDVVCSNDGRCVPGGRCDGKHDCTYGEDEYWCAPGTFNEQTLYRVYKLFVKDHHTIFEKQEYPSFPIVPQSLLGNSIRLSRTLLNSRALYSFWCNRGVAVIILNNVTCFCPPSYYGTKCQFFSDRITIVTHLDLTTWPSPAIMNPVLSNTRPILFKIKVNFLFNDIIVDHYEFYSNPILEIHNYIKHKFYLLYSRSPRMLSHKKARFYNRTDVENNHPYSVHFNIYTLYDSQSIPTILGSWHYPIYFDFLPSFRLATVLRFPPWFGNSTLDPCTNYTCNQNSTCQRIFNRKNSYVCVCNNGYYGKDCSKYEENCNSYCSPHSLCVPNDRSMLTNTNNPFCICPLGHFGPRCYLKFEQCDSNLCSNNGSCVYTNASYSGDSFVCICSKFFYGDRCQNKKMAIQVRLNTSTITGSPRASSIQFYDVDNTTLQLILRHQQVSPNIPSSIDYDVFRSFFRCTRCFQISSNLSKSF